MNEIVCKKRIKTDQRVSIPIDARDNSFEDFLFYDIEVFKENSFVVFSTIDKEFTVFLSEDFKDIRSFIKKKILVGFNNYHYDDYILTKMMRKDVDQKELKTCNDEIIENYNPTYEIDPDIISLDCYQQISVSRAGLKKIEANMGHSIVESSIDFDIDRELTKEELEEAIKYCKNDVSATIDIFKLRWESYFVPKLKMLEKLGGSNGENIHGEEYKWNTTTLTASILTKNKKITQWSDIRLSSVSDDEKQEYFRSLVPKGAWDLWHMKESERKEKKQTSYTHENYNCVFEFGLGGLHGVAKYGKKFSNVKLLDVASMYPNILITLNALGNTATERYKNIVEERIRVKHTDPELQQALKLMINSTYGLMKNKHSRLFNPYGGLSICVYGQIALYNLCERLYDAGYTLVNINTDGVAFVDNGTGYEDVWHEWEEDFNLTLELSEFDVWVQKDVNNYVAKTKEGNIKVKGKDVAHYHDAIDYNCDLLSIGNPGFSWCNTNSLQIISRCVVDYVLDDIDPLDTITKNQDNPIMFQIVLQAGNTFKGTVDENGNIYQKVNRIFAGKEGVCLKKLKPDGTTNRFPDTPEKMWIYNDDLSQIENFKDKIDINFYYKLAQTACNRWN